MDTNPPTTTASSSHYVITLDKLQYLFYQSDHIDICAPDGSRLHTIGYGIKKDKIESSIDRLQEQIYLTECLLCNLSNSLELPTQAVSALADLLCGMHKFCRNYLK